MTSPQQPPMTSPPLNEEQLTQQLHQIQTQLNKKQTFNSSLSSLKSLLLSSYSSSSPPTQSHFHLLLSRATTISLTRHSSPPSLLAVLNLLSTALPLVTLPSFRSRLLDSISSLRRSLPDDDDDVNTPPPRASFLFEGHLTVDPEPPPPAWLTPQILTPDNISDVMEAFLTSEAAAATTARVAEVETPPPTSLTPQTLTPDEISDALAAVPAAEAVDATAEREAAPETPPPAWQTPQTLTLENISEAMEAFLASEVAAPPARAAPPASREAVERLKVVRVDEGVMGVVGEGEECCVCKEKIGVGDEMKEMPCNHMFHVLCLKAWLDERNSCPICRHELPTDDHKYESWKEREKELEEERRGAANALRGGEFMYV